MKMNLIEKFDGIFEEEMGKLGYTEWTELFKSVDFGFVEKRCEELINKDYEQTAYNSWVRGLAAAV